MILHKWTQHIDPCLFLNLVQITLTSIAVQIKLAQLLLDVRKRQNCVFLLMAKGKMHLLCQVLVSA